MQDYLRRFLIAGIMAVCIGLLFLGIKNVQAETIPINDLTSDWMWPSEGVLTDSFGTRNGNHKGIDIAAPFGSPVYAVDNGVVTKSYYSDTYGNVVFINHDNNIETIYAHLQERTVQEGAKVGQGEIIGKMGNTGDSSGVHLHFEVHLKEWTLDKKNAINPMIALGNVEIGQAVAAVRRDQTERALETAARIHSQEVHNEQVFQTEEDKESIGQQNSSTALDSLNTEYTVQAGDTLTSIARKMNISVAELTAINGLTGDLIKPQQKLLLRK